MPRKLALFLLTLILLSACSPATQTGPTPAPVMETVAPSPTTVPPTVEPTATSVPALWISPAVPEKLRVVTKLNGIKLVDAKEAANLWLDISNPKSSIENQKSYD